MTIQEILKLFPNTTAAEWHQHSNGGGWVQNTAFVSGDAQVFDNAWVSGNAQVFGDARVFGDAWDISPLQIRGTRHMLTNSAHGQITIGCCSHGFEYWKKHYRAIGIDYGYSAEQIQEYGHHIAYIAKFGK